MSSLKRDVQITKRIERQSHCKPLWILYMDGTIICGYLMSEDVERKYESLRKRNSIAYLGCNGLKYSYGILLRM